MEFKLWIESQSQLNWIENPDDVLAAMGLIEGDAWMELQKRGGEYSLPTAIESLNRQRQEIIEDDYYTGKEQEYELIMLTHEVYGDGGMHRYYLRGDGTVDFSQSHVGWRPGGDPTEDARSLGFRIV